MSFTTLRTAIMTKLGTITQLAFVDDKHHSNMTGYPAATFETRGLENIVYTNRDNLRTYQFDIILHQEIFVSGRDEAMRRLNLVIDAVIASFDADYTLGGAIHFAKPLPVEKGEYVTGNGPCFYALMRYECVVEENVF